MHAGKHAAPPPPPTAHGAAAWLRRQFSSCHAQLGPWTVQHRSRSLRVQPQQQQQQHRRAGSGRAGTLVAALRPSSAASGHRQHQRQQQQQQPYQRTRQGGYLHTTQRPQQQGQRGVQPAPPVQQARPPGLLQQQQQQEQQPIQQQQQEQQPIQQQQQQQQPNQPYWGYLTGDAADQWTWDDDYNPDAIAKAAAAARQLPLTPRQRQQAAVAAAAAQQRPTVITRVPEQFTRQALSNGVLLVDKPVRWSSADVVRQLKMALKVDKIGAGMPLDTGATGLLIVLLGAACRLTPKLEPLERTYTGTLRLGATTTTYDASGTVLETSPWQHLSDADIASAGAQFEGEVQQVGSMWSSSKYRNKPLRWYAERGESVAQRPRAVHFASVQLWRETAAGGGGGAAAAAAAPGAAARGSSGGDEATLRVTTTGRDDHSQQQQQQQQQQGGVDLVHFRVVAGKGASVRVLAHDLGRTLGCGAHLCTLRREGIGGFSVDTAWSLDVLLPLARKYAKGAKSRVAAGPGL